MTVLRLIPLAMFATLRHLLQAPLRLLLFRLVLRSWHVKALYPAIAAYYTSALWTEMLSMLMPTRKGLITMVQPSSIIHEYRVLDVASRTL